MESVFLVLDNLGRSWPGLPCPVCGHCALTSFHSGHFVQIDHVSRLVPPCTALTPRPERQP